MRHNIEFPNSTSYFIAWNSPTDVVWGSCQPDQVMTTAFPNVWQTSNRAEWITELEKYSVIEGYRFDNLEEAEAAREWILQEHGVTLSIAGTLPLLWIKGDWNLPDEAPQLFKA